MKKILQVLLLIIAGAPLFTVKAQSQFSGWLASFNTFRTGNKTSIHTDVQWRSSDDFQHTQTLLLRSGLNIHLTKKLTITGGYAFIHNRRVLDGVTGYAPEHRSWEQLLYNHKFENIFISHRLRLEQRFISKSKIVNSELENQGSVYANRLRYFFRTLFPLRHKPTFTKGVFAALQNEVFVNIANTANVNGKFFDQNRLYLALGYRLSSSLDFEAGYLNQYISGRNSAFTNNHVLQVAGYMRL